VTLPSRRSAPIGLVGDVIQHVVDDLEGDAEVEAVLPQRDELIG
jgi:hypothetical protein